MLNEWRSCDKKGCTGEAIVTLLLYGREDNGTNTTITVDFCAKCLKKGRDLLMDLEKGLHE